MVNRLHRSKQNKMVAGVAGGLAEYFAVDVALVRLVWVLAVFAGGAGILAYIVLWIVMPEEDNIQAPEGVENGWTENDNTSSPETTGDRSRRQRNAGVLLIGLGLVFLGSQFVPHWILSRSWPLLLVVLGLYLLFKERKGND